MTFTKSEDDEHRRYEIQYTEVMRIDIKEKQRRSLFCKKAACESGELRRVHATSSAIIVARNIPSKGSTITQWFIRNSFLANESQCIGFFSEKKLPQYSI